MPFFKSLKGDATEDDVWALNPKAHAAWKDFYASFVEHPSEFSEAERETLVAYASAMNRCTPAYEQHAARAIELGADAALFDNVEVDPMDAPVAERWKPLLAYVRKLCRDGHRLVQRDADAVLDAGWSEFSFTEAVDICAMVRYGNMVLFGHGVAVESARQTEDKAAVG